MTDVARFSTLSKEMKHREREMVPKALVVAMFGLMFATLALVGFAKITDRPVTSVAPDSPVVATKMIQLDGSRSGGITVYDMDGVKIGHSLENKAGFIDVIWGSILRERILADVTSDDPVRLVRRENGHVAVIDDATGWKIELIGYGVDNVAAFARLID